jgi:hypothetical protein
LVESGCDVAVINLDGELAERLSEHFARETAPSSE